MVIPVPALMGMMMSTPAVWEFTMASLEPVLHHDDLGKQVQRVMDSACSLGVTDSASSPHLLLESVAIAPRSERSPEPSSEFGSSPTMPSSMSSLQPPSHFPSQIQSSPQSKLQDHLVPPLLLPSPLLTVMTTLPRNLSSAIEGSRQTNRVRYTSQQPMRFLHTVPHMKMKRKPKTRVLAFRQYKHSSHFSSSSV
ncbi:hypothetical protein ACFXTH_022332 [Malus domestica]